MAQIVTTYGRLLHERRVQDLAPKQGRPLEQVRREMEESLARAVEEWRGIEGDPPPQLAYGDVARRAVGCVVNEPNLQHLLEQFEAQDRNDPHDQPVRPPSPRQLRMGLLILQSRQTPVRRTEGAQLVREALRDRRGLGKAG